MEVTCKLCGAAEQDQPLRDLKVFRCGTEWHACIGGWRDGPQSERCRVRQLERDQADWRNGVDLIASALGATGPGRLSCAGLAEDALKLGAELERLGALINHPHNDDWFEGTRIEAAHQQERWGTEHDSGKQPQDWFWLIGYLAGKALHANINGDVEKAKHHTISTAAVLLNWHRAITGEVTAMRPGIEEPVVS